MEEFFRQGDLEAKLGMPISPFYDREKTSTAACQMGFINVLVKPLYAEFTTLLGGPAVTECFSCLEANLRGWETHGNELLKMGASGLLPSSSTPRDGAPGAAGTVRTSMQMESSPAARSMSVAPQPTGDA